jgi:hypothetical protein
VQNRSLPDRRPDLPWRDSTIFKAKREMKGTQEKLL